MDYNNPAAAPQGTDANPNNNSNPAEPTPSTGQPSDGGQSPAATSAPDPFDNFVNANGGRDKVYEKMKQAIGDPEGYARSILGLDANNQPLNANASVSQPQSPTGQAPVQQQNRPQPQQQITPEPYKPEEGFITSNEYFAKKYNADLATEYPEIADYVNKGEYLKEATAMGMKLVDQAGNFNDKVIHQFLDMKKAAVAPAPTSTPITTTPTVDYVHQEGDITTQEMADDIMKQGSNHPRYAEAMKFTMDRLGLKTKVGNKQK